MKTQNFGAKLEWDHDTDTIVRLVVPHDTVEDFTTPIWTGATEHEKNIRWRRLVKANSKNQESSLDF